ncbi:recombinase family protein [Sulfurimonas sp.]
MSRIMGYCRVSTAKQETDNQKSVILNYAHDNKLIVDDIIELVVSSKMSKEKRLIDETLNQLSDGDTLLVYALDRIGRSTSETLNIIDDIKEKGIKLIIIKDNIIIDKSNTSPINNMMLTMLSAFAQLERDFISERTTLALQARKEQGVVLGRKKGQKVKSKFDDDKERITELYDLGLSLDKIINQLGYGSKGGLHNYIKANCSNKVRAFKKNLPKG